MKISLDQIRRSYGQLSLTEESLLSDPFAQFEQWFQDALDSQVSDPTAMVLSTVDASNVPDARMVLLKGIESYQFIFYSNYQSKKAKQLALHPKAALTFYWPDLARQIRIRGDVYQLDPKICDEYFSSRPRESQISAVISRQSEEIKTRALLEQAWSDFEKTLAHRRITRPSHWGGYALSPFEIEFWQGRDHRLHDRILYTKESNDWKWIRLAP